MCPKAIIDKRQKVTPPKVKTEGVTLEQALAEEGKTTADIGKASKKAAPKAKEESKAPTPKKEVLEFEGRKVYGYPLKEGKTLSAWNLFDSLCSKTPSRSELLKAAKAQNMNEKMASTQHSRWKTHKQATGVWQPIQDLIDSQKVESEALKNKDSEAAKAAKAAEKEAKAKAKADEKAAKDAEKAAVKAAKEEAKAKEKADKAAAKEVEKAEKEKAKAEKAKAKAEATAKAKAEKEVKAAK